ncbi:hypothetical protein N9W21_04675 [Shewanella sp.]|nr:hypothetical protein [Shewanella sp.]
MLTTMTSPGVRPSKLLLFHVLLVTAWVILAAPLLSPHRTIEPFILVSLIIVLSCINTLLSFKRQHGLSKVAYTLLFLSWMLLWCQQLWYL